MAEGFCRTIHPDLNCHSAGIKKSQLNPLAVQVMKEVGIDISGHHSKSTDELPEDLRFDYVFTVCGHANETCPTFFGSKIIHVGFEDPPKITKNMTDPNQILDVYRKVRNDIQTFIKDIRKHMT